VPTFKPRKVKKTESKYRDRAAERRDGGKSDYAQVHLSLSCHVWDTNNECRSKLFSKILNSGLQITTKIPCVLFHAFPCFY
jgi:hypothetical protein